MATFASEDSSLRMNFIIPFGHFSCFKNLDKNPRPLGLGGRRPVMSFTVYVCYGLGKGVLGKYTVPFNSLSKYGLSILFMVDVVNVFSTLEL